MIAVFILCIVALSPVLTFRTVMNIEEVYDAPGIAFEKKGAVRLQAEQWSIITSVNLRPFQTLRFNIGKFLEEIESFTVQDPVISPFGERTFQPCVEELQNFQEAEKQVEVLLETYLDSNLSKFTANWLNFTTISESLKIMRNGDGPREEDTYKCLYFIDNEIQAAGLLIEEDLKQLSINVTILSEMRKNHQDSWARSPAFLSSLHFTSLHITTIIKRARRFATKLSDILEHKQFLFSTRLIRTAAAYINMMSESTFPVPIDSMNAAFLNKYADLHFYWHEDELFVQLVLKTVHRQQYSLYKMLAWPAFLNENDQRIRAVAIKPKNSFIGINHVTKEHFFLSDHELSACELIEDYVCNSPTFKISTSTCEFRLLINDIEYGYENCQLEKFYGTQSLISTEKPSTWLYSTDNIEDIEIVCNRVEQTLRKIGYGKVELSYGCSISTARKAYYAKSQFWHESELVIPQINISIYALGLNDNIDDTAQTYTNVSEISTVWEEFDALKELMRRKISKIQDDQFELIFFPFVLISVLILIAFLYYIRSLKKLDMQLVQAANYEWDNIGSYLPLTRNEPTPTPANTPVIDRNQVMYDCHNLERVRIPGLSYGNYDTPVLPPRPLSDFVGTRGVGSAAMMIGACAETTV